MRMVVLSLAFILVSVVGNCQYGIPLQRNIIFEGNSLFNRQTGGATDGGQYIPVTVYNNVRATYPLAYQSRAISGRNQSQINAAITTNIAPFAKRNDVMVIWEGTNDLYTNGVTGQQAYDNLMTYVTTVRGYGAKVVVCTVIARDYALDPADLMDRIAAYNTLIRNNTSNFDAVCDLAADPVFDTRADASNTTYYNADKIHQAQGGQDQVVTLLTATLIALLATL